MESVNLKLGGLVLVQGFERPGKIAFIGDITGKPGTWYGVVLDYPGGRNNGEVNGIAYFNCEPNHGLFVKPHLLTPVGPPPAMHALRRDPTPPRQVSRPSAESPVASQPVASMYQIQAPRDPTPQEPYRSLTPIHAPIDSEPRPSTARESRERDNETTRPGSQLHTEKLSVRDMREVNEDQDSEGKTLIKKKARHKLFETENPIDKSEQVRQHLEKLRLQTLAVSSPEKSDFAQQQKEQKERSIWAAKKRIQVPDKVHELLDITYHGPLQMLLGHFTTSQQRPNDFKVVDAGAVSAAMFMNIMLEMTVAPMLINKPVVLQIFRDCMAQSTQRYGAGLDFSDFITALWCVISAVRANGVLGNIVDHYHTSRGLGECHQGEDIPDDLAVHSFIFFLKDQSVSKRMLSPADWDISRYKHANRAKKIAKSKVFTHSDQAGPPVEHNKIPTDAEILVEITRLNRRLRKNPNAVLPMNYERIEQMVKAKKKKKKEKMLADDEYEESFEELIYVAEYTGERQARTRFDELAKPQPRYAVPDPEPAPLKPYKIVPRVVTTMEDTRAYIERREEKNRKMKEDKEAEILEKQKRERMIQSMREANKKESMEKKKEKIVRPDSNKDDISIAIQEQMKLKRLKENKAKLLEWQISKTKVMLTSKTPIQKKNYSMTQPPLEIKERKKSSKRKGAEKETTEKRPREPETSSKSSKPLETVADGPHKLSFKITKGSGEPMGLQIEPGDSADHTGAGHKGVLITSIIPGAAGAKSGKLKIGDHLVAINNADLCGLSFDNVLDIIGALRPLSEINLVVVRD